MLFFLVLGKILPRTMHRNPNRALLTLLKSIVIFVEPDEVVSIASIIRSTFSNEKNMALASPTILRTFVFERASALSFSSVKSSALFS